MNYPDILWNLIQMLLAEKEKSREEDKTNEKADDCK